MSLFGSNTTSLLSALQFLRHLTESEELKTITLSNVTNADYFKHAINIGLEYDRNDGVEILLTHLGVPENLTFKEKVAYYQLIKADNTNG